jgi:hypothetical protein
MKNLKLTNREGPEVRENLGVAQCADQRRFQKVLGHIAKFYRMNASNLHNQTNGENVPDMTESVEGSAEFSEVLVRV